MDQTEPTSQEQHDGNAPSPSTSALPTSDSSAGLETGGSGDPGNPAIPPAYTSPDPLTTLPDYQSAILGEAGIEQPTPIGKLEQQIDVVLGALRRAFATQAGVGSIFERAAREIGRIRNS